MKTKTNTKINEPKTCPFTSKCLIHLDTCSLSDAKDCPEANKIKNLEKTPCPAMVNAGYDSTNLALCSCTISQIRQCLPEGSDCFIGGKCITEYLDEKTRSDVFDYNKSNPLNLPKYQLIKVVPVIQRMQKKAQITTTGKKIINESCFTKLARCLSQLEKNKLINILAT